MAEEIEGFKQLDRRLRKLTNPRDARNAIRAGLNRGLNPVVKTARENAPKGESGHKTYKGRIVSPGFLSRSIKKKLKIEGGSIVGRVGMIKDAFYGAFFETGFKAGGKTEVPADPWLKPSLTKNSRAAIQGFVEGVQRRIKKIAKS